MNMFRHCSNKNIIRGVLFVTFCFICVLECGPLISHSAEENEKFTHTITCTNYLLGFVSGEGLDEFTDIYKIDIGSEKQNEREEFNHHFITNDSTRMSLIRKRALSIYPVSSQMTGYLAPPPKSC